MNDDRNLRLTSLLIRLYDGEISEDDKIELKVLASEDPSYAEDIMKLIQMAEMKNVYDTTDTSASFRRIRRRIRKNKVMTFGRYFSRIAAVLFFPLLMFGGYFCYNFYKSSSQTIEVKTTTGMISAVVLPDSSKVWLNSNSTLKYPTRFVGEKRSVSLDGEAFFDVVKDNGRRFTVRTDAMEIEVLGTKFGVEAYSKKNESRTTLMSGKVRVTYSDDNGFSHSAELSPGYQLVLDKSSSSSKYLRTDPETTLSWKDGHILLNNTPLEDALRMIGNKYNVKFVIMNDEIKGNRYTGEFSGQRLDTIIEHFKMTTNINFVREENPAVNRMNVVYRETILVY